MFKLCHMHCLLLLYRLENFDNTKLVTLNTDYDLFGLDYSNTQ